MARQQLSLFEASAALMSECGRYRYRLTRIWDADKPILVWAMLNPSTADDKVDDPTIRRVRSFTKREGYGGFHVVNLWAFRATSPHDLRVHLRHTDEDNTLANAIFLEVTIEGRDVIVAWGTNARAGPAMEAMRSKLELAKSVRCLGYTMSGEPRHPLMLRGDTPLQPWPKEGPAHG